MTGRPHCGEDVPAIHRWNGEALTGCPFRLHIGGLVMPKDSQLPPLMMQVNSLPSFAFRLA